MKLAELKEHFESELSKAFPKEEIQSFFGILLDHYLNYSRIDTVIRSEEMISDTSLRDFFTAIHRLKQQEPIQYIVGETEFYGLPFYVNQDTLIPRPETEELVSWVLDQVSDKEALKILDIGTGSGCIAVSLAKYLPNAKVAAMDISDGAIEMAKKNAKKNHVAIDFHTMDILDTSVSLHTFDIIVSNPPYVREMEKNQMKQNVLGYEPEVALFVSNQDPLVFYRAISRFGKRSLHPGGFLFFEINEYLEEEMIAMLSAEGYIEIESRKDIFGKDRMIKCILHESTQ